jgi:hypothetical protein
MYMHRLPFRLLNILGGNSSWSRGKTFRLIHGQQIRRGHRAIRLLVEAIGSAHLTAAAESLGAYEASALPLLGLVSTVRASWTLLLAIAICAGELASWTRLASFVAFAFVLEVLSGIARDQ